MDRQRGFSWILLSLLDKLELAEVPKDYQILDGCKRDQTIFKWQNGLELKWN